MSTIPLPKDPTAPEVVKIGLEDYTTRGSSYLLVTTFGDGTTVEAYIGGDYARDRSIVLTKDGHSVVQLYTWRAEELAKIRQLPFSYPFLLSLYVTLCNKVTEETKKERRKCLQRKNQQQKKPQQKSRRRPRNPR